MTLKKILSWTAVIIWMGLIFYLSHQPAVESSRLSQGITEVIIQAVEKVFPNLEFDLRNLNHFVRKNAHFCAYLILGFLVVKALWISGAAGVKGMVLALVICVLYAVSDEVHQMFIPGRSGEVRDVFIDSVGAGIGIGLYWMAAGRVKNAGYKRRFG
ncbi:VanZ family protein [Candidatus Contubernalis alkalaceticus]|nr:VanZ family protein [Candidatus Contubernalis alkalaceticus]